MKQIYTKWAGRVLLLACVLIPSLGTAALATDKATPPYYETRQITQGLMISEVEVNIRKGPGTSYDRITSMDPGETCEVLGEEKDWYHILYKGREGYVMKEFLSVSTFETEVEKIVEAPLEADITGLVTPRVMPRKETFSLQGVVTSNIPLTGVAVEILNLRTLKVEASASAQLNHEEQVTSYDLLRMDDDLRFRKLSAGEKRLTITAQSTNDRQTVLVEDFYVLGQCVEPVHMTDACTVSDHNVTDGRYRSAWVPKNASDQLTIALPEERSAQLLTLEWTEAPSTFTVEMQDAGGAVLRTFRETSESNTDGMIAFAYETGAARKIVVQMENPDGAGICEARVYEQDKVPEMAQTWEKLPDKVDAMVIVAHPGDELLFFGGAMPYLTAGGERTIAVVYLAEANRERMAESLEALWSVGVRQHPIFCNKVNKSTRAYEDAIDLWGLEDTYELLVDIIRRYKPEVILTHDIDGEDGDNQHKLASATVRRAVLLAADPAEYPTSGDKYGVWDVKKTYIHRYEGNVLTLDMDLPLENSNAWTAQELLRISYNKQQTLMDDYSLNEGAEYDHQTFGLIRTLVGDDQKKDSFFENID